jgi:hypothetical protein
MVLMLTGIGVAIDAAQAYYWNASAERAATAAALSGVIFMPNQFAASDAIPALSGNDASDRAVAEARRNRFDVADTADNVQVVPAAVPGKSNQLQVTVSRTVPTLFLSAFGIGAFKVRRTAIVSYLPPISLGQAGNQIGSTVSQLGTGNNYYFMRMEGWSADRQEGDAFTPNPAYEYGGPLNPPSQDVHQISGDTGSDTVDPGLPSRGGYNFRVNLQSPGRIQVYNAVFGPDGNGSDQNNGCENGRVGSPTGPIGPCSAGGNYFYHENDSIDTRDRTRYAAMEYTLFQANNVFIHSADTELAQFKVLPIDASNWKQSSNQYAPVGPGSPITQLYNADGSPANMAIYHSWVDVPSYTGPLDGGLVQRTMPAILPLLPAGTYRLRVDMLNPDGSSPPGTAQAHKGYSVRAVDALGAACADCAVTAWNDMAYFTPISTPGGGSFTIPLFSLPGDYAGQVVTIDIYDPGDISGAGNVDIDILDPTGAPASGTTSVYDLGTSRTSPAAPTLIGTPATATFRATAGGTTLYNGHWVEMQVPIPNTYDPTNPVWSLRYSTSTGVSAIDTVTVAVGQRGVPAHVIMS